MGEVMFKIIIFIISVSSVLSQTTSQDGSTLTAPQSCPGPNEEYKSCRSPCPDTCESIKGPQRACAQFPAPCPGGCECITGYVRNKDKVCVRPEECEAGVCAGPNEVYKSCKNPCPETCKSINTDGPTPVCSLPFPCPAGCDCEEGFVRDEDGVCVKPEQCQNVPKTCPGPNEKYALCKNPCPATCSSIESSAPIKRCVVPEPCPAGCDCISGYVRNDKNICVLPKTCPKGGCSQPNEEYKACRSSCPDTCSSIKGPPRACAAFPFPCPGGCECVKGYVRNKAGICIKPEQCDDTPKTCPGPNEEYALCKNPCPATCSSIESSAPIKRCVVPEPCPAGCDCISGYVRNDKNICVLPKTCPKGGCRKANEEYRSCRSTCPVTCDSIKGPQRACAAFPFPCPGGCECKKGYVRNKSGCCVTPAQCNQRK